MREQFEEYWTESDEMRTTAEFFRNSMARIEAADPTPRAELLKMGPLQRTIHRLKLTPHSKIAPYFQTWLAGKFPELTELVEVVHSITAGCVRVERSIKVQKMIHSKVMTALVYVMVC